MIAGQMAKVIYRFAQQLSAIMVVGSDCRHHKIGLGQRRTFTIDANEYLGDYLSLTLRDGRKNYKK